MLSQPQLAALLIKVAVSASIASIMMRFGLIEKILIRDDRTVADRLRLALVFSLLFGASAEFRILSHHQYQAIDLALEGAQIAGMLGGYVSGLITGICVSIPDMFDGKYMSMPLYAAAAILGALMHDLAPEREDIWYFSPFVDLNLYRLFRQALRLNRNAIQPRLVERAAFNVACNAIVIVTELLRWGVYDLFKIHSTFFIFEHARVNAWTFVACAVTTLFAVSLPIRIWSSYRAEKQLDIQQARLTETRLAALTSQINPHFLFNTLNSIASLIRIDPERARNMIYRLSNIMRKRLRNTENLAPLRDEISFIDDYLAIEMMRFGDKLRFSKEVDEETLDRLVPSMMLQPIIENSIKHGLSTKLEGGNIRLRAWIDGTRLMLSIQDDGIGMDEAKLASVLNHGGGIGVTNVNERLRVLFGPAYRMLIESKPGAGTETTIEIPEAESSVPAVTA